MKTLEQLQRAYKCSLETSEAIKSAIKDYGNGMTAMIIIGRPEYDRSGRIAKEAKVAGVEAIEIYPGNKIGHGVYANLVVVGCMADCIDAEINELVA